MMRFFFLSFIAVSTSVFAIQETARILVHIGEGAVFSAEEFADASSAYLVKIDPRNPFKALNQLFLDHDFVVLSSHIEEKVLPNLARRFGYRSVSFSKETLKEALEQAREFLHKNPKCSNDIPYLSKEDALVLYDLMKKVDRIFTEKQINYWATGGTLIGALSFHGLIPWDDDLDICIIESDEKKLVTLEDELERDGLKLYTDEAGGFYKISNSSGIPIEDESGNLLPYHYPFVDIFVMTLGFRRELEDIYVHKGRDFYYRYPHDYFNYSQIEKIQKVPFGPLLMPIPFEAEQWIEKNYGVASKPNFWKEYAIEPVWSHRIQSRTQSSGAAFIQIDDFSCAPWQ